MNISNSLKKFAGNKNTVTLIGVLVCIVVLYIGYNVRVNQRVELTEIIYAKTTIQPRTKITPDVIEHKEVPASFLSGDYYKNAEQVVGKYSNYNTIIAKGSFFYKELVVDESSLPNSSLIDVPKGETVIMYNVNMASTYANSMMPNDYINIYFKAKNDDNTIMFGKFIGNVKILDVKDSEGRHVFENSEETRTPSYMLFSLPEDMHLLFRKAIYLGGQFGVELLLVPITQELDAKDTVFVSSEDIQNFINDKTEMVSVDEILTSTANQVTTQDTNDNKKTN